MFEELKKLSKHYIVYAFGSMVSQAIGFIMIPVYTRFITPAEYGIVGILNLITWIVSLVLGMNLVSGVTRFYFQYKLPKERNSVVSSSLYFSILLALPIILSLVYFSRKFSLLIFKDINYAIYFKITFAGMFFDIISYIPFACFRIKNMSLAFVWFSLLKLFIALSLNTVLIVIFKLGILGILYSQLITSLVVCPAILFITFKKFGFAVSFEPLKKIISYSLPLVPAGIAMIVLNLGDRYVLKQFVSLEDVGIYTLGYKIAMILGFLVGAPFRYVWQPYRMSIADDKNASKVYSLVFTYFTLFIGFVGLALSVLSKDIIRIIATPAYFSAANVIPAVTLGYIFYQLYYLLNVGMFINNKTEWAAYIVTAAALLNIAMNFLLIPKLGMMAAAYTTLVSFLFLALAAYLVSQRFYKVSYEFARLAKILLVGVILYFVSTTIQFKGLATDILAKSAVILLFPIILYILGFYTKVELDKVSQILKSCKTKFKRVSLRFLGLAENR